MSGLLAVPGGAARAQTGHWSAAMTVGNSGSSYGYNGTGTGYGALTTTGFTIAGTAYTVRGLVHGQTGGTGVNLLLDTALGADGEGLTLELDDSSFDFDDATVTSVTIGGTGGTRYFWAASSPGWAAGDEVAARIAGSSPALTRAPGVVPLASPTITDIAVTDSPTTGATAYSDGTTIEFAVTFSEPVVTVYDNGPPSLTLNIGGTNRTTEWGLTNSSSTPMAVQELYYAVQVGDEDPDGIWIDQDSMALNGATIQNSSGEDAILTHGAFFLPRREGGRRAPHVRFGGHRHGDGRHRAGADLQRDAAHLPSGHRLRQYRGERLLGERRRHGQHGDGVRDRRQHGDADADRRGRGERYRP